jgi:excisionase family DNA binding protein
MIRSAARVTKRPKKKVKAPKETNDVLNLAEAATHLRLSEAEVVRLIDEAGLPGRKAGSKWRFLRSALEAWLSIPEPNDRSKRALLAMAGKFKDDPFLDEIVKEAYRRRGRPISESF